MVVFLRWLCIRKTTHYSMLKRLVNITLAELTEAVGVMQRHIDTGISAEYLLDQNMEDFSAKMVYDLIDLTLGKMKQRV